MRQRRDPSSTPISTGYYSVTIKPKDALRRTPHDVAALRRQGHDPQSLGFCDSLVVILLVAVQRCPAPPDETRCILCGWSVSFDGGD